MVLLGGLKLLLSLQATQAVVAGTVRDEQTATPIAGAIVALSDLNRATTTDASGRYTLRDVPAGPQHVTIRFIGYAARTLHALVPATGQLEISVSLRPQPVRLPAISVRAPVPMRGTDSSLVSMAVDRATSMAQVWNNPMLSEPDGFQALGGGEVVVAPESPTGIHVRGGGSDQTSYILDGMPILNPYHSAGVFSAWNPDALSGLQLSSFSPSVSYPAVLSGTVSGSTRTPGTRHQLFGSVSTTQARLTLDGPVGIGAAGYLLSVRMGFAGTFSPRTETSYLEMDSGDWLAKLELPSLGGRLRVIGYGSDNEVGANASRVVDSATGKLLRNVFQWYSRSLGGEWRGPLGGNTLRVSLWRASGSAASLWKANLAPIGLNSARRDLGALVSVEHRSTRASTIAGVRLEHSSTSYEIESDSARLLSGRTSARTVVATVFGEQERELGPHWSFRVGGSLAAEAGHLHFGPRAQLRWRPTDRWSVAASGARLHQFAQSLKNSESVVGAVFPADLFLGTDAPGIPAARSDLGVIALDFRPTPGTRLGLQAYERNFDDVVLVAPRDGGPFATDGFVTGSGNARGLFIDAALSRARWGLMASYGVQQVRLDYGDSSYVPHYGTGHLFETGLIVFPTTSSSIRIGITGAAGRNASPVSGGFEWESCNLADGGCEFLGNPETDPGRLGASSLPYYLRVDLGLRKHWHLQVAGRDALIALFGTVTNLLRRTNVLTFSTDPQTGQTTEIEMRPRAPLVVGVDWRF